ncbi:MAG: hypothetical protein RL768_803 [Nitrospirota bacterium]|jgi:hypothetical protein
MRRTTNIQIYLVGLVMCLGTSPALADSLSTQDREEINRLRSAQGHSAEEVNGLLEQVIKAGEKGLPTEPLANKVKEGLAKGVEPKRIDPVVRQLVTHFESAQEILQESTAKGMVDALQGNRQRALEGLAEALSRGTTAEEVRELAKTSQGGGGKVSQESLASGAKSLAILKEARIPSKDGTALVAEGIRQGYRSAELADLARELKRRGSDIQQGRVNLQNIKDQVSKGQRADRIFRDSDQGGSGSGERMDRSGSSDRGGRDDRGGHDDRSGSGGRDDRGSRPDRSGSGHGGRDH